MQGSSRSLGARSHPLAQGKLTAVNQRCNSTVLSIKYPYVNKKGEGVGGSGNKSAKQNLSAGEGRGGKEYLRKRKTQGSTVKYAIQAMSGWCGDTFITGSDNIP